MDIKLPLAAALLSSALWAHFGVLLPTDSSVSDQSSAQLDLTYKFMHPFEQQMMQLDRPREAGVFVNGKKEVFSDLSEQKSEKLSYFSKKYSVNEPGIYQFYMDPEPYFEPAEGLFIRHITKSIVNAYGHGEGWDEPIGLKAEIVPLARPFGLYAGNIFSATVLYKGKPAKNVSVEIELYNDKGLKAPSEDHITQEVKTNDKGEFSFVMPVAGWWGFSALIEDDEKIKKDGKEYGVELGAVLWVQAKEYQK